MIWWIVGIIGAILMTIIYVWSAGEYDGDGIVCTLVSLCLSMLAGVLILVIGGFSWTPNHDNSTIVMDGQTELVALKDNFGVDGNHFLFSNYVNSEMKYIYIAEDEIMGMQTHTLDPDYTYIKYIKTGETPYIQRWHWEHNNKVLRWLFSLETTRYTVYLPENSVIENVYGIDLE